MIGGMLKVTKPKKRVPKETARLPAGQGVTVGEFVSSLGLPISVQLLTNGRGVQRAS